MVNDEPRSPEEKRRGMTWAQRLKRVFGIDVTTCVHCGGAVRIVASIEEPAVIRAILGHFAKHGAMEEAHYRPPATKPILSGRRAEGENETTTRCGREPQGCARPTVGNR